MLDYVTVHDAGRLLNPLLADGQVRGGFAHGAGAALLERVHYDDDGNLLTGSFVDYLCLGAADVPPLRIGHRCTPSPFTLLGAKGLGEGNTMSVPAALAAAVADALGVETRRAAADARRGSGSSRGEAGPLRVPAAPRASTTRSSCSSRAGPTRSRSPAARAWHRS